MKNKKFSLYFKKKLAAILHGLFLILSVSGFAMMYFNCEYGEGLVWIKYNSFEDTAVFSKQLQSDITHIFDYVNYKDIFELNGQLNLKKNIISVNYGPGSDKIFSLEEIIQYAKGRGYFLDEDFKITGRPLPSTEEDLQEVTVNWRAYAPDPEYEEPGDAYYTLEDLSLEILTYLGEYYSTYHSLIQKPSNLYFRISYEEPVKNESVLFTNVKNSVTNQELRELGKYLYVSGESIVLESNLSSIPRNITPLLEYSNPYNNNVYEMIVAVDKNYTYSDTYARKHHEYQQTRFYFALGFILLFIGGILFFITLYYLVLTSAHKLEKTSELYLHKFDYMPFESCIAMFFIFTLFALFIAEKVGYNILYLIIPDFYMDFSSIALYYIIIYGGILSCIFSLLRRYKADILWSGSLTKKITDNLVMYFENRTFTIKVGSIFFLQLLLNVIFIASSVFLLPHISMSIITKSAFCTIIILWFSFNAFAFHHIYQSAMQKDKLFDAISHISEGDIAYKINTSDFTGRERVMAENLNNIGHGLETAIQENVKSERLKTDLITNVSHDIKTPLTSIINYVDLIKRENITNEKVLGYLDVLEQKSYRLKTLTEDLVEASKASSGNMKLEISNIDFIELTQQTTGEFKEKFAIRHLEIVTKLPDEPVIIEADGRHLWRVLENLYNNAFKYSMPHSRVYIEISISENYAIFTIKNISENSLNFNAEDLTERFVRGDVSRATEGSGLGLSIAKSLTELQHGIFEIFIDGDLFKVQLKFSIKSND